jgi:hypothetical protein
VTPRQIRALGRGTDAADHGGSPTESDLEAVLTAHSISDYVLRATLLAKLVDMDIVELSAFLLLPAVPVENSGREEKEMLFYATVARMLLPTPLATTSVAPRARGTAHQALRRHICSLKSNLFSEEVLASVTSEWRDLLVRLAVSTT